MEYSKSINLTDNLNIIIYSVDQAKSKGVVESITMSGKTLRNLTLSLVLDEALKNKGWKETLPHIIDQSIIEFIIGGHIIIDHGVGDSIKIRTIKETTVKWE